MSQPQKNQALSEGLGGCQRPFTTADADRLLGLGDQLLSDWKQAADLHHFGEVGLIFCQRRAEWQAIRPLLAQAPALRELLNEAVVFWGNEFADPDNPVDGGDLVEWFAEWLPRARRCVETSDAKSPPAGVLEAPRRGAPE